MGSHRTDFRQLDNTVIEEYLNGSLVSFFEVHLPYLQNSHTQLIMIPLLGLVS